MKPDTNTMSTDHNSDVLKIFGIDSNIIEHYDIFHRKDGVHIILKLINREQRCPVCQTRTTKVVNYIDKKIKHSVVSTSSCFIDYHARRYRCPACNKTFYESNPFTFGTERISSATVYSVLQDLKKPFETWFNGDIDDVPPSLRGLPQWFDATIEDLQELYITEK